MSRVIAWVSGIITLLLVVFAFLISYSNLVALGEEKGLSLPGLLPWILEGAVIVFSVQVLRRSMQGERAVFGWILVIGASLTAGLLNVIHSQNDPVARVISALPSLLMLLAFEAFLSQLKDSAKRSQVFKSLDTLNKELSTLEDAFGQRRAELDAEIEQRLNTLSKLEQQIEQLKLDNGHPNGVQISSITHARTVLAVQTNDGIDERRGQLVQLLIEHRDIGATELADRLNASRSTVYNDLNALSEQGVVQRNGQGWTVVEHTLLPAVATGGA